MTKIARWALLLVTALGVGALGAELAAHFRAKSATQRPYLAQQTKRFSDMDYVRVPVDLNVPDPDEKTLNRLRRDYGKPNLVGPPEPGESPAGEFPLGEWKIDCPPDVRRVEVLATATPEGNINLTVRPKQRTFLGAPMTYGGLFVVEKVFPNVEPGVLDTFWHVRAQANFEPLRVGRVTLGFGVSAGSFGGIEYVGVGVQVRF